MTTTTFKKPTKKYLKSLVLRKGMGSGKPGDRCAIQEVRAWLDLPANTDEIPPCVDPVIGKLVISVQDYREEWRAQIVPLLPRLIGSNLGPDVQIKRAFACADWAVRVCLPLAVDAIGLSDQATTLRSLLPVTDKATAEAAAYAARVVSTTYVAANTAYAAAYAAARAADAADAASAAINPVALIERLLEITE